MSANVELTLQRLIKHQAYSKMLAATPLNALALLRLWRGEAADSVYASSTQMATATESSSGGFSRNALAINTAALSAAG